jgi:protein gp37
MGFDMRLVPERLCDPFKWRKPRMIFVNSMSDLFHEGVPDEYVAAVTAIMLRAHWHVYQVLTKRSARMRKMLTTSLRPAAEECHIWWGVSVENKKHGLPRIQDLKNAPAAIRFLSIEPLLEDLGELDLSGIHWVIVGGESGGKARPMQEAWVTSIRDQCAVAGVPFFFKQWGGFNKSKAGRLIEGRTYDAFPAVMRSTAPDRTRCQKYIAKSEGTLLDGILPAQSDDLGTEPVRIGAILKSRR